MLIRDFRNLRLWIAPLQSTCEKEEKKNDEMSFFEGFLAQRSYSAFLQMVGELFENKSNEQIKVYEIVGKTMKFEFDEKKYKIVLSELKE